MVIMLRYRLFLVCDSVNGEGVPCPGVVHGPGGVVHGPGGMVSGGYLVPGVVPGPGWGVPGSGWGGTWSWVAGCLVLGGLPGGEPPRDGYCCGRYASYWNAFLLVNIDLLIQAGLFVSESYHG